MQRYCPAILLLLTFLSSSGVLQGENEDFRIQTTVHVGSSSSASVNSLTLFNSATIYDFLDHGMDQSDITVFDITRGRFVLLDPQRRVKTTLTKDFLIRFLEQIRSQTSSTALANYVQPKLEHEFNPVTKTVRVSSDYLTYQATGITPKFDSAVQRYTTKQHPHRKPPAVFTFRTKSTTRQTKSHAPEYSAYAHARRSRPEKANRPQRAHDQLAINQF